MEAKVQPILGYRVVQIGFGVSQIHVFDSDSVSVKDRQNYQIEELPDPWSVWIENPAN